MSLRRSLRRYPITEVLNMGLDGLLLEANKRWRKRGKGNGGEAGLSMLSKYTQVENGLRLRLRYFETLYNHFLCYQEYLSGLDQQISGGDHGLRYKHADLQGTIAKLSCRLER